MSMLETQTNQIDEWKKELHAYEKGKRTKKPYGKSLPKIHYVSNRQVKQRQGQYNPILQTYRDPRRDIQEYQRNEAEINKMRLKQMNRQKRYSLPYDIVNLNGSQHCPQEKLPDPNKKLGPVRNIYNIINNQVLPQQYLNGRDVRLSLEHPRHIVKKTSEEYDAVLGSYRRQNEEKQKQDQEKMRRSAWMQYSQRMNELDLISGKYYSKNLEKVQQQHQEEQKERLRKKKENALPLSYKQRQKVVINPYSEENESFKTLDVRRQNTKKRYQQRYLIQDQYRKRNEEYDEKNERVCKNHVHDLRIWEQKSKQFDIINSKNVYPQNRADQLFGRTPARSSWAKTTLEKPKIKSGGFD